MKTTSRSILATMLCAGAVTAQFVGGKATRDALFLASVDVSALPAMLIATSVCSILLVAANSKAARRFNPSALVPAAFAASGVLFLFEWLLTYRQRSVASVLVYLHVSGAGPLLASGFWLFASERFDPRTAKKRFGQFAGAGTLGGLLCALLAERVAAVFGVAAMLPFLAAIQFASAWLVRQLAVESDDRSTARAGADAFADPAATGDADVTSGKSGFRVLA